MIGPDVVARAVELIPHGNDGTTGIDRHIGKPCTPGIIGLDELGLAPARTGDIAVGPEVIPRAIGLSPHRRGIAIGIDHHPGSSCIAGTAELEQTRHLPADAAVATVADEARLGDLVRIQAAVAVEVVTHVDAQTRHGAIDPHRLRIHVDKGAEAVLARRPLGSGLTIAEIGIAGHLVDIQNAVAIDIQPGTNTLAAVGTIGSRRLILERHQGIEPVTAIATRRPRTTIAHLLSGIHLAGIQYAIAVFVDTRFHQNASGGTVDITRVYHRGLRRHRGFSIQRGFIVIGVVNGDGTVLALMHTGGKQQQNHQPRPANSFPFHRQPPSTK